MILSLTLNGNLVPKAGVLFPLKAPSNHKRSCFIDNDEAGLDQGGHILVYDLVYYAEALTSQTKQIFSAAIAAIWKRVPWGQMATVHGARAAPRGGLKRPPPSSGTATHAGSSPAPMMIFIRAPRWAWLAT